MILRTDFTRQLVNDAIELYWKQYTEPDYRWRLLFNERPLPNGPLYRSSTMLSGGDLLHKKEHEPISFEKPQAGWDYAGRVHTFAKGIEFSMEAYEDTQVYDSFMQMVADMANAYPRTRERFYANFFNFGALTAGHEIFDASIPGVYTDPTGGFVYDGKPFFADAGNPHILRGSAKTFQNYFPLELTFENLETVWRHMVEQQAVDENGNPIIVMPDTLLVPPHLYVDAWKILTSEYLPHTATTPSIRNPMFQKFQILEWPALTHQNGWFLLEARRGLTALTRKELEIDMFQDMTSKSWKASVNARFGGMVDDVRYICACNTPQS